jgi:hypothetical protein
MNYEMSYYPTKKYKKKKTYKAGEMWVDFKLVAEPIVKYKECELNSTNKSQVE